MSKTVNDPTGWIKKNLPVLPKGRRWKLSIKPHKSFPQNRFSLTVSIQRRILFWWEQDFYTVAGYNKSYVDLKGTLDFSISDDIHDPEQLDRIIKEAGWLKGQKYPDLADIPQSFEAIVGIYT